MTSTLTSRRDLAAGEVVARIRDLGVQISGGRDVIADVDIDIAAGEIVGLVGESGSGKTTVSMALLGYSRRGARIVKGSVEVLGQQVLAMSEVSRRALRGDVVAYIPQDPAAALNPGLKVKRQLAEVMTAHRAGVTSAQIEARIREVLGEVGLPVEETLAKYPHQLSGGQQQRVGVAMALMLKPNVLVLDEPTTGLDVSTQARILKMLRKLCIEHAIGALYVTHDLSVVAEIADRVVVMYAGRIVESGPVRNLFDDPRHPYSRALLGSIPDVHQRTALSVIPGSSAPPGNRPSGCAFHPRCPLALDSCRTGGVPHLQVLNRQHVRCVLAAHTAAIAVRKPLAAAPPTNRLAVLSVRELSASYAGSAPVLRDVAFDLHEGECLAIVGESGSGKSTLARCVIGLHAEQHGKVVMRGEQLVTTARRRTREQRKAVQYIFQSPFNSLNPRKTVAQILQTARNNFLKTDRTAVRDAVREALERVGLSASLAQALPDELSGGERQRVSIARALICEPEVLLCDEITSALDVSVQAAILELLRSLQRDTNLSMLFVTHNLAVVRNIADRVLVLGSGSIVEEAATDDLLDRPVHPYTKQLLMSTPSIEVA